MNEIKALIHVQLTKFQELFLKTTGKSDFNPSSDPLQASYLQLGEPYLQQQFTGHDVAKRFNGLYLRCHTGLVTAHNTRLLKACHLLHPGGFHHHNNTLREAFLVTADVEMKRK